MKKLLNHELYNISSPIIEMFFKQTFKKIDSKTCMYNNGYANLKSDNFILHGVP